MKKETNTVASYKNSYKNSSKSPSHIPSSSTIANLCREFARVRFHNADGCADLENASCAKAKTQSGPE
jgi:hypothetical protein